MHNFYNSKTIGARAKSGLRFFYYSMSTQKAYIKKLHCTYNELLPQLFCYMNMILILLVIASISYSEQRNS